MRVTSLVRWTLYLKSSAFEVKYIEITYSYKFCSSAPFYQWNTESCKDLTERISKYSKQLGHTCTFRYRRYRSCGNSSETWCSSWRLNRNCLRRLKSHRPSSSRVRWSWGAGPLGQAPPPAQRRAARRTAERGRTSTLKCVCERCTLFN